MLHVSSLSSAASLDAGAAEADDDEIAKLILGRSGTLRAPAFRAGRVFMVGYSEEAYTALFG